MWGSPVFSSAKWVQFAGAAHCNDQQQTTHQAAHSRCGDDFSRQSHGAV